MKETLSVCCALDVFSTHFFDFPPRLTLSGAPVRVTRGKRLTQLLLISLVVYNSGSPSLCPVNEDADVIELPTPPLLCTVGTPHPLSQTPPRARVQCCCCIFSRLA